MATSLAFDHEVGDEADRVVARFQPPLLDMHHDCRIERGDRLGGIAIARVDHQHADEVVPGDAELRPLLDWLPARLFHRTATGIATERS